MIDLPDSTDRADGQVVDHRSPDLVNKMTLLFEQSETYIESTVLAIRGDHLALALHEADAGPEIVVGRASPTGEIESLERWEAHQLGRASDRLNELYREVLGDAAPACSATLLELDRVSHDASELGGLAAILADDLTGDSYETVGQLSQQSKSDMLAYYAATADLPGLFITRKVHAISDHTAVASVVNVAGYDTGALTERPGVNFMVVRDSQLAHIDQWEIEDLPAALARFDQW